MRWLNSITDSMDMYLSKLQEIYEDRGACCATVHEVTKNRTRLVTEQQQTIEILFSTTRIFYHHPLWKFSVTFKGSGLPEKVYLES